MVGITNLDALIKLMRPSLAKEGYVFCTVSKLPNIKALMVFKEKEGLTLILEKKVAEKHKLHYSGVWKLITLTVHSDLSAVGFLARITAKLAAAGISVNAVSAYYHDHLFVPQERAEEAMKALKQMTVSL